jgi:FkbM family methyltransferase
MSERVLIEFDHGIGDAIQLTAVLQHLRKYRPEWELYLWALRGKHSVGHGYCKRVWHDQQLKPAREDFDRVFKLDWWECGHCYADSPSTKAAQCLRDVFGLQPDPELMRYKLHVSDQAREVTRDYLEGIGCRKLPGGRYNAVAVHYEGNTSVTRKNLDHATISELCESLIGAGFVPLILDWDKRSPLPDGKRIHCPGVNPFDPWGGFGSGDAERLTALISQCSLFVGIDSGPQKAAAATDTPAIGVWTFHHPIHFLDLAPNVLNLVPEWLRPECPDYFAAHYRHRPYGALVPVLVEEALNLLGVHAMQLHGFHVHPDRPGQDWVVIEDVYIRDAYKLSLINLEGPANVIDVGAHIGTFCRLVHEKDQAAKIVAVEVCPENLDCLKANVGEFATVVHAACTYEPGELALLNAVAGPGESTGGSIVCRLEDLQHGTAQYLRDTRPLAKVTLDELMERHGMNRVDLLKLDCEGSEFSILEQAPLERIGFIVCESHDPARWRELLARRFSGWDVGHMSANEATGCETWHLRNPAF